MKINAKKSTVMRVKNEENMIIQTRASTIDSKKLFTNFDKRWLEEHIRSKGKIAITKDFLTRRIIYSAGQV